MVLFNTLLMCIWLFVCACLYVYYYEFAYLCVCICVVVSIVVVVCCVSVPFRSGPFCSVPQRAVLFSCVPFCAVM